MPDLTPEREAAIRERESKATKPPWHAVITGPHDNPDYAITQTSHVTREVWHIPHTLDDVPFIAHARQDIPDLLAALDALRAELAASQQARDAAEARAKRYRATLQGIADVGCNNGYEHCVCLSCSANRALAAPAPDAAREGQ